MTDIQNEIQQLTAELPTGVRLVAVSKYQPEQSIQEAYDAGQRIFGESHALELQRKHAALPKDIEWHFIGHLQTNKIKYIAPFVSLIHAVDSFHLLQAINKQAEKMQRVIPCLLQLHVACEESKFGFSIDACRNMLLNEPWRELKHIEIHGLMCMASHTDDTEQIRQEFHQAAAFFEELRGSIFHDLPYFNECSWGMSDDFPIAIEEKSTLIRVGSRIFGARF